MQKLDPVLMFDGDCEEAMNFYKDCLKGEFTFFQRYADSPMEVSENHKNKIVHCELTFEGGIIMASDQFEDSTKVVKGNNVQLSINFGSVEKIKEVYELLKQGGEVTMELQDTFWNAKFATLVDKFGIHWMLNCQLDK